MGTSTYGVSLAAVPVDQIEQAQRPGADADIEIVASRVEHCAHDVTGVELFPLADTLSEAIDIGQPLRNDGWHPLRAPIVVDPETVTVRTARLDEALRTAAPELAGLLAEALGPDIHKVHDLYAFAAARGEAVISFLTAPGDDAEAPGTLVPHIRLA